MNSSSLREFLDRKVCEYNQPSFITSDPICIPHTFSKKQDIEIAGFFAAIFSWGNRTTIIKKSKELMELMDMAPHQFIVSHREKDLKRMLNFKHRTFNATDLLYFFQFLQYHYTRHATLEKAFCLSPLPSIKKLTLALDHFYLYFFSLKDAPFRTHKHIACPAKKSTCKRLNMFLRWMVRKDRNGVDFGIWSTISASELVCPVDLHVARVAKRLKLLARKQVDWKAALELTDCLKRLDPADPVKYDFALFGLGIMEKF